MTDKDRKQRAKRTVVGAGMSFHWRGRNKQGVSMWVGSTEALRWVGLPFRIYGTIAGCGALVLLLYSLLFGFTQATATLTGVGLLHGVIFNAIGIWAQRLRRYILRLSDSKEVCEQLGLDKQALEQLAQERGIKPRYNINDEDFYDLNDFTEAQTLLRAASPPMTAPETLLRPATGSPATPSEQLLRAAEKSDS